MLDNETLIKHQIICYYPCFSVGDTALYILTNFTTDANWENTTIPGASWDEILESKPDPEIIIPVYHQLNNFKKKYGSKKIKQKWQEIWRKYKTQIYWDSKDKCFKLKNLNKATSANPRSLGRTGFKK